MSTVIDTGVPALVMLGAVVLIWANAPRKAAVRAASLVGESDLGSLDESGLARAEATMAGRVQATCGGAAAGIVLAAVVVAPLDLTRGTSDGLWAVYCVLLTGAFCGAALTECAVALRSVRPFGHDPRVAALSTRTLSTNPGRGQRLLPLVWIAVTAVLGVVAATRQEPVLPYVVAVAAGLVAWAGISATAWLLVRAPRHAVDGQDAAGQDLVLRDSIARLTAHLGYIGTVLALFAWSFASQHLGFAALAVAAVILLCAAALNRHRLMTRVAAS